MFAQAADSSHNWTPYIHHPANSINRRRLVLCPAVSIKEGICRYGKQIAKVEINRGVFVFVFKNVPPCVKIAVYFELRYP